MEVCLPFSVRCLVVTLFLVNFKDDKFVWLGNKQQQTREPIRTCARLLVAPIAAAASREFTSGVLPNRSSTKYKDNEIHSLA